MFNKKTTVSMDKYNVMDFPSEDSKQRKNYIFVAVTN